ncbi:MAG TPA: hypothetical protein VN372_01480 [Methanospirillum sp.]|nr:hypothetical protein [Methanospirillum sp.]
MSDITFLVSIISSAVAGVNTIAMVLMYRRYLDLARLSVTFAGEVIGHLHAEDDGTGERTDPTGLIASSLDHLGRLSVLTKMV